MEPGPAKVVTLDSDSDNELEIISENIPNYGNYSTPVEIVPELQEKIRISLEKRATLPGKIKTIKVYATVKSSQVMGSVTASFRPPGGQPSKTINVGASINDLFSTQVRGAGNNNSKKPQIPTASDSAKPVQVVQRVTERPSTPSSPVILYSPIRKGKTVQQKILSSPIRKEKMAQQKILSSPIRKGKTSEQKILSSPIRKGETAQRKILSSPIRKGKTAQQKILSSPIRKGITAQKKAILDRALPTLGFQQTATHSPENPSPSTPSLISCKKTISITETKTSEEVVANIPKDKYDRSQEFSKTVMKTSEEFQVNANIPKDKYDLSLQDINLNTNDPVFKNVCAKVKSVELSPIRFSSDDDEEQSVENSMLGIWNSPVQSTHNYMEPLLDFEQNSPFGTKVNSKDCDDGNGDARDVVVNEKTLQNMPMHLVMEMWDKMNQDDKISKQQNLYEKESKMNEEEETEIISDVYNEEKCSNIGSENQNSNYKFGMSKYVKINVETLPKRLVGSSVSKTENESFLNASSAMDVRDPSPWSTKDDSDPPLWTTKEGSDPPLWMTIFPPRPPSPPPESWTRSSALWELDVCEFEAVTGLCGHQTAKDFKRKLNEPKPLVRVLRKRPKN